MNNELNLKGYYPALDGLRGLSILLVIFNHWTLDLVPIFDFLRARGHLGVEVFFSISGFLVARSLHVCFLKSKGSTRITVTNFMVRRLARIFVPYVILLIGVFSLSLLVSSLGEKIRSVSEILYSFPLYFYNYAKSWTGGQVPGALNISWSLWFEEQFYLFFAGAFFLFGRNLKKALWVICLGSILFRFVQIHWDPNLPFFQLQMETHRRMDAILWGVLIYLYWPKISHQFSKNRILSLVTSLAALGVFLGGTIRGSAFVNALVFTGTALFFSLLLVEVLVFELSLLNKVLKWGPIVFIGKISYEIYLTHQLVNGLVIKVGLGKSPLLYGLLYIVGTILLSFLFYRYLSIPSQQFLRNKSLKET